ncbi:MAG: alpha/beta fold hydrolase [Halanaerobiales bacterium]|nr:alpha/beta fold hydrolase [Halanaerobiales bacterium]
MPQISIPTLVFVGRQSQVFPWQGSKYVADKVPNSELEIFENCGHMLFLIFFLFTAHMLKTESENTQDYQTYIIKEQYFAVNFDNENDSVELIMPDGSREVLERQNIPLYF